LQATADDGPRSRPSRDDAADPTRAANGLGRATRIRIAGLLLALVAATPALALPATSLEVAQGWVARSWTQKDGLPVVGVNSLTQGEDGYLWLATFGGLVRFDGARFTTGDGVAEPGPAGGRFTGIWRGKGGALWLATGTRFLTLFQDGRWSNQEPEAGVDSFLRAVCRTPAGTLLFGIGSSVFPEEEGQLGPPLIAVPGERIQALDCSTPDLWIGTVEGGVYRASRGSRPPHPQLQPVLARSGPVRALLYRAPTLWIGTDRGLRRWSADRPGLVETVAPQAVLRLEGNADGVVFSSVEGIFRYRDSLTPVAAVPDLRSDQPLQMVYQGRTWSVLGNELWSAGKRVLRAPSLIRNLFADDEGSLWLATTRDGLVRLRPSLFAHPGAGAGSYGSAYPIAEGPDGRVWVGFDHSTLLRIGPDGSTTRLSAPLLDTVRTVLPEAKETLVGGVGLWRVRGNRLLRVPVGDGWGFRYLALYRDRSGVLWAGTLENGVLRRRDDGSWQIFPPGRAGLPDVPVRFFFEDSTGTLWAGTEGAGLLRVRGDRFEPLGRRQGLPSDLVRDLWDDGRGNLWVATEDRGLVRLRLPPSGALQPLDVAVVDRRRGLPMTGVHRILPDGSGRLWLSSNQGISVVDYEALTAVADDRLAELPIVRYTAEDGLPATEANGGVQSAGTRTRDGRLWFPTVAGYLSITPGKFPAKLRPLRVIIEGLKGPGPTAELRPLPPSGQALELERGARAFEVWYTAPTFVAPDRTLFRYRVDGGAWVDAGHRRQALITDLGPGTHRIEAKAARQPGSWTPPAHLSVRIPPFWWERRATRGGAVLFVVGFAVLLVARRARFQRRLVEQRDKEIAEKTSELADALQQARQQAETLREMDETKSKFFAHISHELRTPLTVLLTPLLELERDPEQLLAEAPVMRRAARGMQRMIDQILDLEKSAAGQLQVHRAPTDLVGLVRRVASSFAGIAESWGLELAVETEVDHLVASLDSEQFERALGNLVSNALRFTDRGGRVTLRIGSAPDESCVEVADTGHGIRKEELERIFDRFYQVGHQPGRTRGTGLGLPLVRELVELHGGKVEVESALGQGSVFRIRLPQSPSPAPMLEAREPDGPQPEAPWEPDLRPATRAHPADAELPDDDEDCSRPLVLVIEDHLDIRRSLVHLLSKTYRVEAAADGEIGLVLARRSLPDLVVTDVNMPGLDGFTLARRLLAEPETEDVPIVFLTARASTEDELEGFASGGVGYVRKPFDSDLLSARIDSLLDHRRRLQRRWEQRARDASRDGAGNTDDDLGARARAVIQARLHDDEFGLPELARELALGRTLLFTRFRDELNLHPGEMLRALRLERARALLESGEGSVAEVAYAVGFTSRRSFTRAYRSHYGEAPSSALRRGGGASKP